MSELDVIAARDRMLGEARAVIQTITDEGTQLPDIPCRFVKLENWDTDENFQNANPNPIYWGYNSSYVHRIAPGGNSELLPVANAREIWVRTPPLAGAFTGTVTLYWSYYR